MLMEAPRTIAREKAAAIALNNVTRRFVTPDGKMMTALRDFTMNVAQGEFACVVGPTGCGKSTTLNLVTGLAKPSAGEVRLMGKPIEGISPDIGFVFQADALFPWLNVIDNVSAGPRYRGMGKEEAYEKARSWITRVGLARFEKHYPHQSGASVIFVTHDLEEAIALADKVYVLTAGPATVKSVYDIDIPRPRVMEDIRYDSQFVDIAKVIWDDLREEVQIGQKRALANGN